MLEHVFIANRGEIAARVARTCDTLGIDATISAGDYLDPAAQVAQALAAGADSVHPGYGFLSENAGFARAVAEAGLVWIGPSPEVMEQMGRKDAAREIAVAAGVPVVPRGEDAGFPVLVKAAAGGGGKGMRVVRAESELAEARAAAAREALSAFGDDVLLVEKYVERGRHIEVQVIGDSHGTVHHLFERDCSTQRRHQKVLEEAPAPTLTDEQRTRVLDAAVALASHVGYVNAGTVEFLLDDDSGEVYFLEMNTRLQVEHPVTEAITGLDLVELQLRVAAGEPLDLPEPVAYGHAIEARVYAEDSFHGFLPQAGTATVVQWPEAVRVDHALESGQTVSTAYDPMLGKIIAFGSTREDARRRLVRALDDTAILGLTTNAGFLRTLVASDEFRDATIDTAWLDRNEVPEPDPGPARELAAWAAYRAERESAGPFASDGFRLGSDPAPVVIELDEPVVLRTSSRAVRAGQLGAPRRGRGRPPGPAVRLRPAPTRWPTAGSPSATVRSRRRCPAPSSTSGWPRARAVEEGQVLGVVEAMKMELSLKAPFAGTVTTVGAVAGRQVALGDLLFEVESADD